MWLLRRFFHGQLIQKYLVLRGLNADDDLRIHNELVVTSFNFKSGME